MRDPLADLDHIDLLHPTRNAFARRWDDCRLQTAEALLLGFERDDDLPGHLIPYAWFNFIRSRSAGEVPRILEHNHWDVRSLAALLLALAEVYADPRRSQADTLGVARSHRRKGAEHDAVRVLANDNDSSTKRSTQLATLHRRHGEWQHAVALWQRLDAAGCLVATETGEILPAPDARFERGAVLRGQASELPNDVGHHTRRAACSVRSVGPASQIAAEIAVFALGKPHLLAVQH
jgi:hypothetical protein